MEPESTEEETIHIRNDIPLGEIQMGTHIESMRDMRLTLGSPIEVGQWELITGWWQHSRHVPYEVFVATSNASSKMDWREIMSWYPLDGTVFFVGSTSDQGPLDIADVADSS